MQLTSYRDPGDGRETFGRWTSQGIVPIRSQKAAGDALSNANLGEVLARGTLTEAMRALEGGRAELQPDRVEFLPTVPHPGKLICIGANYWDHCREAKLQPPDRPILFAKWPNAYAGHRREVPMPIGSEKVDYEGELGVVIGRRAFNVSEQEALSYVAGYTPANDLTARDFQFGDKQWSRGKSPDDFGPMGPVLVTADEVADPQALPIWCEVNGVRLQDSNTKEMIFSVAHLISFISRVITLDPGDVIFTGTPHGVGIFRDPPVLLHAGDVIRVGIADWPPLENVMRAPRS